MCLLCFFRFSELLDVALSDKLKRYKPSMSAEERSDFTQELRVQHLLNVEILHFFNVTMTSLYLPMVVRSFS